MAYTYLLIDLGCIILPFIFSFIKLYPFYKKWRYFFPANILTAAFFIIWDIIFTAKGVWGFNPDYLIGINIFNLPIEEILFFICIPYACVFAYFSICSLCPRLKQVKILDYFGYCILLSAILFTILGYDKLYTFFTGLFTSILMFICLFYKYNLRLIIVGYLAVMPFFFLSNGLLTGSFLENPIVWYNDMENLSIRLFTIPVEDTMYGFLLILMNIRIMDYICSKRAGYEVN